MYFFRCNGIKILQVNNTSPTISDLIRKIYPIRFRYLIRSFYNKGYQFCLNDILEESSEVKHLQKKIKISLFNHRITAARI